MVGDSARGAITRLIKTSLSVINPLPVISGTMLFVLLLNDQRVFFCFFPYREGGQLLDIDFFFPLLYVWLGKSDKRYVREVDSALKLFRLTMLLL